MRKTFVFDINSVIGLDALESFEATMAYQFILGNFAVTFQNYSHLPKQGTNLDLQYQKLTQYIAKLIVNKELNTDKYPEVYDNDTIKDAFKNAPLDDVVQVLKLLEEMTEYPHCQHIREDILNTACETPGFYQQTPDQFLEPEAIPAQLEKFYHLIKDKETLVKKFNINIKNTCALVKDDYKGRQAIITGVLKTWQNSQENLTRDDINWLREVTANLKNEYDLIPTALQEILHYCKNAVDVLRGNPLTTLGFSGLLSFIVVPNFLLASSIANHGSQFINELKKLIANNPRPFNEAKAKALDPYFNVLYKLARRNNVNIAELDREAEEYERLETNINATPFIVIGTAIFLSLFFLGHYKNAPVPMPLPKWVITLERSLDSTHRNQYKM